MIYTVSINYYDYIFDDRSEALDFAELALLHQKDNDRTISISIKKEKTDEERN